MPADESLLPFDTKVRPGSQAVELKGRAIIQRVGDGKTTRTTLYGSIPYPKRGSVPEPSINDDVSEAIKGEGMEPRQLELRQVIDPPGNEHFKDADGRPRDREYYEVWVEDEPVGIREARRGVLRRVGGDTDAVIVADVAGYKLGLNSLKKGVKEYGNMVARHLQHIMKAQHPWSSSLRKVLEYLDFGDGIIVPRFDEKIEAMRAKYLDAHRWHPDPKLRGEPLLCYFNGKRFIAWFDPSKNIDPDNPLAALLFLDGGPGSVDDVVRSQWEARNLLPKPEDVAPKFINTSATAVRASMIGGDYINGTALLATCAIGTGRHAGATLYRLSETKELEERKADGTWSKTTPAAECGPEGIVVVPEAVISQDVVAGVLRIPIIEELLGPNWKDLFRIGDDIVIAPGTPAEEVNTVVGHGSLILARPLRFSHPAGTQVALVLPVLETAAITTGQPVAWLRADAGVELKGTNVLSWKDQAGGISFVNPEGGRDGLPVWVDSGLGMPAIRFKGDEWISGGIAKPLTNATIFTLSRFSTATSSGRDYIYSIGTPGVSGSMMTLGRRSPEDAYHYDGRTIYAPPETSLPGNAWQVFTQVYGEGDPASHQLFLNGGRIADTKATAPYSVDASQMFLGNYESGSFFFIGDVVEWILFDRVFSLAERVAVETYLEKRGGIFQPAPAPANLVITIRPATAGVDRWTISWQGEAGRLYHLDRSTTLESNSWNIERTITPQSRGTVEIELTPTQEEVSSVFYRLRSN